MCEMSTVCLGELICQGNNAGEEQMQTVMLLPLQDEQSPCLLPVRLKKLKKCSIIHKIMEVFPRHFHDLQCLFYSAKETLVKSTISFQEEESEYKKTSLCSHGSGLRGKYICQPHFVPFGAPELQPKLLCSQDPPPCPHPYITTFIRPSPQKHCEENRS